MKKFLSFCVVGMVAVVPAVSFAASGSLDTMSTSTSMTPTSTTSLSAAPNTSAATSTSSAKMGNSQGEYKAVSCNTNTAFSVNSCDQCFDGGSVKVGARMTGIFDNWTNSTPNMLVAYKDEQKSPNMVKFGNTTWTTTPADESKVFVSSTDVAWTTSGSGTKLSFMLNPGQTAEFLKADLAAGYTLEKTDKKNGEMVGMLRFPVVSHSVDLKTAAEGSADTHYECVAYKLDAPTIAPVTPETPATPAKPTPPKEVTQTQTGPETLLLIAAAFFIAFGMMFALRRRM